MATFNPLTYQSTWQEVTLSTADNASVYIRKPLTSEARAMLRLTKDDEGGSTFAGELIKACVCNERHEALFTSDEQLNNLPYDVFTELGKAALTVAGFAGEKKDSTP